MKEYGVVKSFDDYNGIIEGTSGINYILNYNEIEDSIKDKIQKGDYVEFVPEKYNTIETNLYIARAIKKYIKEEADLLENETKGMK